MRGRARKREEGETEREGEGEERVKRARREHSIIRIDSVSDSARHLPPPYRGTSLIRNRPPPSDHHMTIGVVLL